MAAMIDSTDTVTRMLPVNGPMRLHFCSGADSFAAELGQDLLGDWIVTQIWTGKPNARGGGKTTLVASLEAGFLLMQSIAEQYQQRGYRLL